MNNKILREIFCIVGSAVISSWIWYSILGNLLSNGKPLEIQDHDWFLVFPKIYLVVPTFIVILALVYLLRWFYSKIIGTRLAITLMTLTTIVLIIAFINWLYSLYVIRQLGNTLFIEINGNDRIQMSLLYHAILTFTVGVITLFDMTIGYKLFTNKK